MCLAIYPFILDLLVFGTQVFTVFFSELLYLIAIWYNILFFSLSVLIEYWSFGRACLLILFIFSNNFWLNLCFILLDSVWLIFALCYFLPLCWTRSYIPETSSSIMKLCSWELWSLLNVNAHSKNQPKMFLFTEFS